MQKEANQPEIQSRKKKYPFTKSALISTAASLAVLFPVAVYMDASDEKDPGDRSEEIHNLIDNREAKIVEGVLLAAGVAMTVNSYLTGRKYDEKYLRAVKTAAPVLLTAAVGSALVDSHTTINYAVPAGLTLASTYAFASSGIQSTFERTKDFPIRASSVAFDGATVAVGMTVFLLAADKL